MLSVNRKFPIFLSSLCMRVEGLKEFRERIYKNIGREKYIYVDEQVYIRKEQDNLGITDELISRIREADIFICILASNKNSSSIKFQEELLNVSFFEIELVLAALFGKKIYVFIKNDFEIQFQLKSLFDILYFAFPSFDTLPRYNESDIEEKIKKILDNLYVSNIEIYLQKIPLFHQVINRIVQGLYTSRAKKYSSYYTSFPDISSVYQNQRTEKEKLAIVKNLMADINTQYNEEKKISRLWLVLRELGSYKTNAINEKILEYWDLFLKEWSSAGAWYGLHAHTPFGCLSSLYLSKSIRKQLSIIKPEMSSLYDERLLGGAFACTKYSIAKKLYIKRDRKILFNEAFNDIETSLNFSNQDRDGLLSIRGSIFRQIGKPREAIKDYEESLKIKQKSQNILDFQIGVAMNELGFGYIKGLQIRKGLEYCEEGVLLIKNDKNRSGGFLVRALRKLAIAYATNGYLIKAFETYREAKNINKKYGTFDQL